MEELIRQIERFTHDNEQEEQDREGTFEVITQGGRGPVYQETT